MLLLRSVDSVNGRRRSLRSPTVKPGMAFSPALVMRRGSRLGFTRRRMAQQVSALFVVDELEVEAGFGRCLETYHDTVL
jgi:hypothetical protein